MDAKIRWSSNHWFKFGTSYAKDQEINMGTATTRYPIFKATWGLPNFLLVLLTAINLNVYTCTSIFFNMIYLILIFQTMNI